MISVSWDAVRARRLARQSLLLPAADLLEVARATCGIHAQIQTAAELSLSARVAGVTQQQVRDALWRDRTLVKAWTVRGTLHLHPADELPVWLAARRAVPRGRPAQELDAWRDPKGVLHPAVTAEEVQELEAAVWAALDGRCLLREELAHEVVRRVGPRHRGRLESGFAWFTGELVQGPPQGNKITLARPDQWIDGWRDIDEREALFEVCRRYLYAYGPARPVDFREWFGEASFDSIDIEEIDVEGHRAFVLAGDNDFPEAATSLRLLPEYDVYVMGFREREQLVPDDVRALVAAHGRGKYEGPAGVRFLLIDGVARGLWERKKRGRKVDVTVTPARRLTRMQRTALDAETARIVAFLTGE